MIKVHRRIRAEEHKLNDKKGVCFLKILSFSIVFTYVLMHLCTCVLCEEEILSPKELVMRAWEAWGAKDYEKTFYWTDKCIELYKETAQEEQASLNALPPTESIDLYEALNAVGTSYFIQGEAYLSQGKTEDARSAFNTAIEDYSYAQNWDPRGWFWSVKEKTQASLEKIDKEEKGAEEKPEIKRPATKIVLYNSGTEDVVNYDKYGDFRNIGTDKYRYVVKDPEGLAEAVGEGIYPNTSGVIWDPRYRKAKSDGRLEGNHWEFVNIDDLEAGFYKWTQAPEPPGVRLFYSALALEKSGLLNHAIKAYYAIVVHFPKAVGWTYFRTPWYISQVAIDRIEYLLKHHPELDMELRGARVFVKNGFDNSISNDRFIVNPGKLAKKSFIDKAKDIFIKDKVNTGRVVKQLGDGRVDMVQYKNGHWQLRVEGRPYIVKGIAYSPNKVGQSPDEDTLDDWMQADYNSNGKIDGPYDSWVDKNFNNIQDADEKDVGDFQLLKEMGCNAIRLYHHASNKALLKDLYNNYGIMVIMGDLLGAYTVGSGADWYEGTDYSDPEHRKTMMESVKKMVREFKNEPYVLFWMLGNENNYGVANNAKTDPEPYYEFVNEVARMIKSMDRDHPVALCNGDLLYMDKFAGLCPDVDIYGVNAYRGDHGFGRSFFENVKYVCGKPVMITEYGCPSFIKGKPKEFAETEQADYLKANWEDLVYNSAGHRGVGNSIGGILFEWIDEWWKAYEPTLHDTESNWAGPFPDGWNYEEWLGIAGQGDGKNSPFLRQLKKAYFVYQEIWAE